MSSPVRDLWYRRDRSRKVAAYGVAALGIIGLLSAASRPLRGRLDDLLQVVPFLVPHTAAVTLVFVSFALLLTARGLRRGHHLAWFAAIVLLAISMVLHVVKGIDVEEAVLASVGATYLATHRDAFPVWATRASARRALTLGIGGGLATLVVAIALSATVGRAHRPPPDVPPHTIAEHLGADYILPLNFGGRFGTSVLIALSLGLIASTLWVLFSPRGPAPLTGAAHHAERERARALIARYGGGTLDYFALRDDKQWFFTLNSVVAHAVRGGVCLVSPDPIGPVGEREDVWSSFMAYAEESGWSVTVLGAAADWLPIYEPCGLRAVYLGDEAVVDSTAFSLEGRAMRGLRQAYNRLQRAGFTVSFHDPATLDPTLAQQLLELAALGRRGDTERGFSMTLSRLFDPEDTGLLLSVTRDATGCPQGFVQWVPARDLDGWSLDVMRRNVDAALPNGIMDFLVIETIKHVAAETGGGLDLNFAVMRSVVDGEATGWLARAGRTTSSRTAGRAQIESLLRFNAKYQPRWVPRYVMLGSIDNVAGQGLVLADAEGITELPVLGRFLGRNAE
ncbi:bifunctional lysylphosphatidylglycerol flippase/synthetase MprF [Pengzhenrongella sp.]|uniref:bifunctional lysylphosphatidylglycerol flippase/synthetase MprF n=1 Tax=Pengzhenrongella sp. TaxID=2888820 RepID=UPI002F939851